MRQGGWRRHFVPEDRQIGLEDYSRHAQQTRGKGHCEVLMIKWPSRTELHNSVKAKAVSNLNRTAGLTWGLPVGGHNRRRQFKVTQQKSYRIENMTPQTTLHAASGHLWIFIHHQQVTFSVQYNAAASDTSSTHSLEGSAPRTAPASRRDLSAVSASPWLVEQYRCIYLNSTTIKVHSIVLTWTRYNLLKKAMGRLGRQLIQWCVPC